MCAAEWLLTHASHKLYATKKLTKNEECLGELHGNLLMFIVSFPVKHIATKTLHGGLGIAILQWRMNSSLLSVFCFRFSTRQLFGVLKKRGKQYVSDLQIP